MHIYTILIRWGRRNVNIMEAKLNFYLRASTKAITGQVFIHRFLIAKLRGFWIEVHPDPDTTGGSLPLLFRCGLSFVCTAGWTIFLSLLHYSKDKKTAEI